MQVSHNSRMFASCSVSALHHPDQRFKRKTDDLGFLCEYSSLPECCVSSAERPLVGQAWLKGSEPEFNATITVPYFQCSDRFCRRCSSRHRSSRTLSFDVVVVVVVVVVDASLVAAVQPTAAAVAGGRVAAWQAGRQGARARQAASQPASQPARNSNADSVNSEFKPCPDWSKEAIGAPSARTRCSSLSSVVLLYLYFVSRPQPTLCE